MNCGADPTHTYTEASTYTATVSVRGHHGPAATAEVEVVVEDDADLEAPQTTVTGGPVGTVRSSTAVFRLGSSETDGTFECSVDGRPFRTCASPLRLTGLRDGGHALRVRAVDAAGNADATPVLRRWVVDTRGPAVRDAGPKGAGRDRTPRIRATVTDALSKVARRDLTLRIDGRVVAPRYVARTGRLAWTPQRPMSFGRHTVRLVATDAAGNRTVRTWKFTIRR